MPLAQETLTRVLPSFWSKRSDAFETAISTVQDDNYPELDRMFIALTLVFCAPPQQINEAILFLATKYDRSTPDIPANLPKSVRISYLKELPLALRAEPRLGSIFSYLGVIFEHLNPLKVTESLTLIYQANPTSAGLLQDFVSQMSNSAFEKYLDVILQNNFQIPIFRILIRRNPIFVFERTFSMFTMKPNDYVYLAEILSSPICPLIPIEYLLRLTKLFIDGLYSFSSPLFQAYYTYVSRNVVAMCETPKRLDSRAYTSIINKISNAIPGFMDNLFALTCDMISYQTLTPLSIQLFIGKFSNEHLLRIALRYLKGPETVSQNSSEYSTKNNNDRKDPIGFGKIVSSFEASLSNSTSPIIRPVFDLLVSTSFVRMRPIDQGFNNVMDSLINVEKLTFEDGVARKICDLLPNPMLSERAIELATSFERFGKFYEVLSYVLQMVRGNCYQMMPTYIKNYSKMPLMVLSSLYCIASSEGMKIQALKDSFVRTMNTIVAETDFTAIKKSEVTSNLIGGVTLIEFLKEGKFDNTSISDFLHQPLRRPTQPPPYSIDQALVYLDKIAGGQKDTGSRPTPEIGHIPVLHKQVLLLNRTKSKHTYLNETLARKPMSPDKGMSLPVANIKTIETGKTPVVGNVQRTIEVPTPRKEDIKLDDFDAEFDETLLYSITFPMPEFRTKPEKKSNKKKKTPRPSKSPDMTLVTGGRRDFLPPEDISYSDSSS